MDFLTTHWNEILGGAGALFLVLAAIIALTPRKDDDEALRGFLGSPLARRLAGTGALATAAALAASLLGGCGGSGLEVTRHAAAGGAIAVVAVDPMLAAAYDDATDAFESGELDAEAVEARLRRLDRAERALRSLSSALTAVDLALGAYEDGRECGLRSALDGAAAAAREVVEALDAAGLDVPPLVSQMLGLAGLVIDAPVCEPESAPTAGIFRGGFRTPDGGVDPHLRVIAIGSGDAAAGIFSGAGA